MIILIKGGKVLLWNQVKSRMEACYYELILNGHRQKKIFFGKHYAYKKDCNFEPFCFLINTVLLRKEHGK